MAQPIKFLLAEDSVEDAELLRRALHKAGYLPEWRRVDTEEAFLAALHAGLDLVFSDYSMPRFTGLRALELIRARHPEIPFIIVSGTIGEETAVEAMRLGATDFVLKNRLDRLGPAIGRALELGRLRREQREGEEALRASEERFRNLIEHASDMISVVDGEGVIHYQSPSTPRLLGYPVGAMLGRPAGEFIHPDDWAKVGEAIRQALLALDHPVTVEFRIRHQDRHSRHRRPAADRGQFPRCHGAPGAGETVPARPAHGSHRDARRRHGARPEQHPGPGAHGDGLAENQADLSARPAHPWHGRKQRAAGGGHHPATADVQPRGGGRKGADPIAAPDQGDGRYHAGDLPPWHHHPP